MRKSDIIVGERYAYTRNKYGGAAQVLVVATGDFGYLSKWHRPASAGAIRTAAGLPDDAYVAVKDENASVAIRSVLRHGSLEPGVTLVSARFIKRTWTEQAEVNAANAARREEQLERAAHDREVNIAHGQAFHAEALEFLTIAESLGIVSDVTDNGFGGFRPLLGTGFQVNNSTGDGIGWQREVTLSREAVGRLVPLLAAVERLGLHLGEEAAA